MALETFSALAILAPPETAPNISSLLCFSSFCVFGICVISIHFVLLNQLYTKKGAFSIRKLFIHSKKYCTTLTKLEYSNIFHKTYTLIPKSILVLSLLTRSKTSASASLIFAGYYKFSNLPVNRFCRKTRGKIQGGKVGMNLIISQYFSGLYFRK